MPGGIEKIQILRTQLQASGMGTEIVARVGVLSEVTSHMVFSRPHS
jgi:hypothetical protein